MQLSNNYIEIARKKKKEFDLDFAKEPKVAFFMDICQIFGLNRLLEYRKKQDKIDKGEQGLNCLERI